MPPAPSARATAGGRPVALGDAAIFSFNGNKTVTAGGGGMIVLDDAAQAQHARALSTQAREGGAYRYLEAGFNFRLPNVNAALGLAQLGRLDVMLASKRTIAARYDRALAGRNDLVPMPRCRLGRKRLLAVFGALREPRRRRRAGAAHGRRRDRCARVLGSAVRAGAICRCASTANRCRLEFVGHGGFAALFEQHQRSRAGPRDRRARGLARRAPEGGRVSLLLVGAGGHARAIVEALAAAQSPVDTYVDPRPSQWLNAHHLHSDGEAEALPAERFVLGVGGMSIEQLSARLALFHTYRKRGWTPRTVDSCERHRQRGRRDRRRLHRPRARRHSAGHVAGRSGDRQYRRDRRARQQRRRRHPCRAGRDRAGRLQESARNA